jgi:hypothetical protein
VNPARRAARRRAPVRCIAAVLLAGLVAAGCGLPDDRSPRTEQSVPYNLKGPDNINAPPIDRSLGVTPEVVYLVRKDANNELWLVNTTRELSGRRNLQTVLQNLMAGGVYEDERERGLRNLIPAAGVPRITWSEPTDEPGQSDHCSRIGASVRIDVSQEFFEDFPSTEETTVAIGQIVLTVFDFVPADGVKASSVQFTVDGRPRVVPTARTGRPVSFINNRNYYDPLVPDTDILGLNPQPADPCDPAATG